MAYVVEIDMRSSIACVVVPKMSIEHAVINVVIYGAFFTAISLNVVTCMWSGEMCSDNGGNAF